MTTPVDASMMNPVELFMTADWVVKSVMVGLAAASIWSWTIIIDKAFRFTALNRQADDFDKAVQSGRSLEDVAAQAGPQPEHALPRMLVIALSDWREARQKGALNEHQGDLLMTRIDRAMNSLIQREGQRIENGLGVLSMGMSGDYETAIRFGATHVRIGSALFGERKRPDKPSSD